MKLTRNSLFLLLLGLAALFLSGCLPQPESAPPLSVGTPVSAPESQLSATPIPQRPKYNPGELVDYTVISGDTLPVLAIRFNTSVEEIREANPIIPPDATTLPPGMPMQMPIYYRALWGSPFQILPDSLFINGPAQIDFDTSAFVDEHPGWLREYRDYAAGANRTGAEIIDYVALNFSVSPRVLLALLEYQTGALTNASLPQHLDTRYPLGHESRSHRGLYLQLVWAANQLNHGYYSWRSGRLITLNLLDDTIEHPDPWQTAASVAFQYYFSLKHDGLEYQHDTGPEGIAQTYQDLFGDPWMNEQTHIPGSLLQPTMVLPFERGKTWAYTGGPHTGWGTGQPFAAIDFAPPSVATGCVNSDEWATAVADGVVARTDTGVVELDLDGDGDPRTGWVVFYLHIAARDRPAEGTVIAQGAPIGHPSCEGGTSTGTHIHIARKYNGEWVAAEGTLAFNLDGWIAHNGYKPYAGTLTRFSQTVTASVNAAHQSFITAEKLEGSE
ncbi:MAG: LysM peptidoglycan-binding domain-containing protein [Anaerolineales bacterium]|nr:LysM peptidoglycan-binding domain-containing protein [Anaerolineales bacterium]